MTGKKVGYAALGGGAGAVASQIPGLQLLNLACCALVVGGGILAVYLALRDDPPAQAAPYGEGAKIGALAGVFGSVLSILLALLILGGITGVMGIGALAAESAEDFEALGLFSAIAGLGVIAIVAFSLIINVAFSTIGGVIGAAIVHRKAPAE
ncbi:MAG: hypothetical protein F4X59_14060 [Holophagales bacterium]|nr:hypothetical protein [Holophagales bacterium]MXX60748.1 hypothetical protein [Holophagales bacterium]MYC11237.1 hypothetical protein [Holophagales bacterium]MYD20704.1 hypothetical protein [Holophagales bacterium]MYI33984.1 hypothetical protein [Holophagales bacterium]